MTKNPTENGLTPEELERYRRKQVLLERERYGMHRFQPYLYGRPSQKKRRILDRRLGRV